MFPGEQYRFDGPEYALCANSESGWVDTELLIMWFKMIFLKFAGIPLQLLIDAIIHTMSLELVDLCQANNVILFCLLPHTQPLDVSIFNIPSHL